MDCVNHIGINATAFCQNCGKALCASCVRNAATGQLLCEPCAVAWQSYQQPFVAPPPSGPNPSAAAVLGLIPGVGAMYNGQFFKGFIHVLVFAILISITSSINGIFGIFIGAWVLYQSFEAFHTAKAMREGQPLPDPFGLNEVGSWLSLGVRHPIPGQPGAGPASAGTQAPNQPGQVQNPFAPPVAGFVDPNAPPPLPHPIVYPLFWKRGEPMGAIVLIGLGLLFLLSELDVFHGQLFRYAWPLLLIALGVWLIVRRMGDSQGGPK